MTAFSVIALLGTQASGATGTAAGPLTSPRQARELTATPRVAPDTTLGANRSARPQACTARKGLRFYTSRLNYWRSRVGAGASFGKTVLQHRPKGACPRYLAKLMRSKARAARWEYIRWHAYHWDWWKWLPSKWQRIGACETGYGRRPGNWRHSNSSYEGAFGFAKSSWDSFKYRADPKAGPYPADAWQATPRQQYEVALAIYRAYGLSGWGCRNA